MTALPQISRFIDSNITEGDFKVALSELRDYLNGLLGEDGTPATAGKKLNLPMSGVLEKTQDCTATSADKGKVLQPWLWVTAGTSRSSTIRPPIW